MKIGYLARRLRSMSLGRMTEEARKIHQKTGKPTLWILLDMTWCGFAYLAGYMDYAVFEFYNLNGKQRKTHVTRGRNNEFVRTLNNRESWHLFDDKSDFNRTFARYLGREWLDLSAAGFEEFKAFAVKHGTVIVKPRDGTCGRGIEKLCLADFESAERMYEHCRENRQDIVEEVIRQHDAMNRINPSSVNTLRIVTITKGERVTVVFCGIRIGTGSRVVDNLNNGGLAAIVDAETGIIVSDAADKDGRASDRHPETGTVIRGFQVPLFSKVRDLINEVARIVPDVRYVGWDVAVTQDGVLLIEGNHFPGHDIYQMPALIRDGYGLLPLFEKALK